MSRLPVVERAARAAGLPDTGIELLREGSHGLYRLPGGVVARLGERDTWEHARRELAIARWLATKGIDVVRPARDVPQPTLVDGLPVTWWEELPRHRAASPGELGAVLRKLHALPVPEEPSLPVLDPFAGFQARIDAARLPDEDRRWLLAHLEQLRAQWAASSSDRAPAVVHGDAWQGNVAVTEDGPSVLLDLDHMSIGPFEWDLVAVAADHTDFARIGDVEYRSFVDSYGGYDVTVSGAFLTMAAIAELRWTCFALGRSGSDESAAREARHRLACLRGEVPRPWTWNAL